MFYSALILCVSSSGLLEISYQEGVGWDVGAEVAVDGAWDVEKDSILGGNVTLTDTAAMTKCECDGANKKHLVYLRLVTRVSLECCCLLHVLVDRRERRSAAGVARTTGAM